MKLGANFEEQQKQKKKTAPPQNKKAVQKSQPAQKDDFDDFDEDESDAEEEKSKRKLKGKKIDKTVVIIVLFVLVFVIATIFVVKSQQAKKAEEARLAEAAAQKQQELQQEQQGEDSKEDDGSEPLYDENGNMVYDEDGNPVDKDAIKVGDPTYDTENFTTDNRITEYTFVKDLNGAQVPADYTVVAINYVDDHANYVAHRSIVDEGMELYWLDIKYKGKKYICQCSFNFFRHLERSGICKVKLEVLTLQGGGTVISDVYLQSEEESE